jgi:hypothetical protein
VLGLARHVLVVVVGGGQQLDGRARVERPVRGLLLDRLVDRRLEALEVDDEGGVADVGDLAGIELDVVRLGARFGQLGDRDRVRAEALAEEPQRVERGHHVEAPVRAEAARPVTAGRERPGEHGDSGGREQAAAVHHATYCAPYW